jgi:TetR/AcrR family transcriptional regulator
MPEKLEPHTDTERRILEVAKKVFVQKGLDGTSMQDIASAADISRTSLHYYFRNKRRLFETVLDDLMGRLLPQVEEILFTDRDFREKLGRFVSVYLNIFLENPYLPNFVMNELNQNPAEVIDRFSRQGLLSPRLQKKIRTDLRNLNSSIEASQFMMNVISLCVFPFIARPVVEAFFAAGRPDAFERFIEARKAVIVDTLISSIATASTERRDGAG